MVYTLPGVRLPTVPSVYKLGSNGSSSNVDRRNAHLSFFLKNKSHSRKICCGKSHEPGFPSSMATASENVLVPGTENDESLSLTEELDLPEIVSDDSQACVHENIVLNTTPTPPPQKIEKDERHNSLPPTTQAKSVSKLEDRKWEIKSKRLKEPRK